MKRDVNSQVRFKVRKAEAKIPPVCMNSAASGIVIYICLLWCYLPLYSSSILTPTDGISNAQVSEGKGSYSGKQTAHCSDLLALPHSPSLAIFSQFIIYRFA